LLKKVRHKIANFRLVQRSEVQFLKRGARHHLRHSRLANSANQFALIDFHYFAWAVELDKKVA
jgi:hypothetical protein